MLVMNQIKDFLEKKNHCKASSLLCLFRYRPCTSGEYTARIS